MSEEPKLSILIVSWNVRDLLLACLRSIARDPQAPRLEVIVVDNASSDDTVAAVLREFGDVRLLANVVNVGFPRANNQALAMARGTYVLYLNPDTEVRPGTLAECVAELEGDESIGMVGCRLESPEGLIQYEAARNTYRFRHLMYELLYLHMLFPRSRLFGHHRMGNWDHRGVRDVEALNGAFMMTRRELAVELGGLPEEVFMYHEDLSFCLRVLRRGLRIRYRGDISALHHWAQSSSRSSARLGLLEAECKHRFVSEADGPAWGAAARVVLGVRAVLRMGLAATGVVVPSSVQRRYPRVFDMKLHWLQLKWSIAPALVEEHMPSAPAEIPEPLRLGAWAA